MKQIADGDATAFRQFFHEYWDNIYSVAYMIVKSDATAEDLVQDIFIKIWLNRAALPGIDNIRNYLFVIARNHIFNELRKRAGNLHFTEDLIEYFSETTHIPDEQLIRKESRLLIQKAIEHLPEQQRTVYTLSRDQGLKQEEIAEKLNLSRNTVRNHMAKAMLNIRKYLEQYSGDLLLFICLIEALLWQQ